MYFRIFLILIAFGLLAGCCCFFIYALFRQNTRKKSVDSAKNIFYVAKPSPIRKQSHESFSAVRYLPELDSPPKRSPFELITAPRLPKELDASSSYRNKIRVCNGQ
ncbi:unnamed protein product [Dracunculus medinensis]|uniref:Uncharacterized protein n=1 Tax=Dracunculus medinensis TaxID=318479 RepID=A0A0N4UEC5_DRAME|nr:unnamed protein product [Dracunculus medinensis]